MKSGAKQRREGSRQRFWTLFSRAPNCAACSIRLRSTRAAPLQIAAYTPKIYQSRVPIPLIFPLLFHVLYGNLAAQFVKVRQWNDMRAGPTIRPRKTAAHVCSLPPCFTASRSAGILPANWTLPSRANGESNLNGERQPCQLEAGATESRRARRDFLIATPVRIESGSISLKAKEKTFSNSNKKRAFGVQSRQDAALKAAALHLHLTTHNRRNFARRLPPVYANFPIRPRELRISVGITCCWERLACGQSRSRNFREGSF
jgi:hypothetical protein